MRNKQVAAPQPAAGEVAAPLPAAGEVRVRLCWRRVPACDADAPGDASGLIDAVGAGVAPDLLGQPVWLAGSVPHGDPVARWATLPARRALPVPDGVPLDAAACLGTPALAAMHAVRWGEGSAGACVLVDGGGPIAHYALQFARLAGAAPLIARVGDALHAGIALDAGAHATLLAGDGDARVRALSGGVDRVISTSGDLAAAALLRDGGELLAFAHPAAAAPPGCCLRLIGAHGLGAAERHRAACAVQALLERGLLSHRIVARFAPARLDEAMRLARRGDGAVLLELG